MFANPLPLPTSRPRAYGQLTEEPVFDPRLHLALEPPARCWSLADFGYTPVETQQCLTGIAVAGPFRVLSEAGVAAARSVALALQDGRQTSDRTASYLAGGVYRSAFFRDLCNSPELAGFLSQVCGCELLPHTMPSQQVYINYAPEDLGKAVDTWHTDSIGFDIVLMLSDPAQLSGGQFQFFQGTMAQAAALLEKRPEDLTGAVATDLPEDRVVSTPFPAAGYAVLQQGSMVVHRATRLQRRAERITTVIGYVARNVAAADPTRDAILGWGEPGVHAEYARHKAWLARTKLDHLIGQLDIEASPAEIRRLLDAAIADARHAIDVIGKLPG
jgi:hypothetical protein